MLNLAAEIHTEVDVPIIAAGRLAHERQGCILWSLACGEDGGVEGKICLKVVSKPVYHDGGFVAFFKMLAYMNLRWFTEIYYGLENRTCHFSDAKSRAAEFGVVLITEL